MIKSTMKVWMTNDPIIAAVICAAGSSSRMARAGEPPALKKEYRQLNQTDEDGRPLTVLGAALSAFAAVPRVSIIVISVPPDAEQGEFSARAALPRRVRANPSASPRVLFTPGGNSRRASVHHALSLLAAYSPDYVLIHDGARPWVDAALIERVIDAALEHNAVVPVLPLTETPKELDEDGFVLRHHKRARFAAAQTPQAFAFPEILRAHERASERELRFGVVYTDDAEVWGEFCGRVFTVAGSPVNKKITFPEDLIETPSD
jgi:2-C-methyl-D-erythritol 4-phosphate cytidylyltransferase